ncbi:MAG: enoyl-CoA hydratase/isomerase family protein [Saprospiraceae bacterium]|nr:enoyl-CoA hydratase/isomerase family protein [Saprospiraceae bacterium]
MIKYKKDTDNIVTLILDMSHRNDNVINHEIGQAFLPVLKHLQQEKKKGTLRGIILTSAKKRFLAGGDLGYLYHAKDANEIFQFADGLKQFLRDLESPGVPVVAAINGDALGAGFELALGCHHRIVIDSPKIKLGLPEVRLGLIPGSGGIIRLMWLLGIERAFDILSSGLRYRPKDALRVGIIDELAKDQKEMMEKARHFLLHTREGRRPWDQEQGRIPNGTAKQPEMAKRIRILATQLAKETYRNYPAQQAILNILSEGSKVDFDTACRIGTRYYTQLVLSPACKNMIKAFWFDYKSIKEGEKRPRGFGRFRPRKVGIIGAGLMGSGIAYACLLNGLEVVIKDVSRLIAERGRMYAKERIEKALAQNTIAKEEAESMLARITTTEDPSEFESCDLVIEAVFENAQVKQKVTREAEAYMDDYSVLASNTVSIPITELAQNSLRPDHYVGLHFFHPADQVPLVEIVKGAKTSEETIARAFDFVNVIKKIPIVVKDDWGFYAARVQNTFILEGITLLQEGCPPALIENLSLQAGMPKGALSLADDLGLGMVLKYEHQAAAHYGNKYIQHPAVSVLQTMIDDLERTGKYKKAGFYQYEEGQAPQFWEALGEHYPLSKKPFQVTEIIERLLFAQVIEAVWCLQENVIRSIPEANLGSIFGWGFPAFKGGVIQYIQDYGVDAFLKRCNQFKKKHGQRFSAPKKLRELIAKDQLNQVV